MKVLAAVASSSGTTASEASTASPMTTMLLAVPRPGRSRSGIQASKTRAPSRSRRERGRHRAEGVGERSGRWARDSTWIYIGTVRSGQLGAGGMGSISAARLAELLSLDRDRCGSVEIAARLRRLVSDGRLGLAL